MSVYAFIPPKLREVLFLIRGGLRKGKRQQLNEIDILASKDSNDWYKKTEDVGKWRKAFKNLIMEVDSRGIQLAEEFYKDSLQILKEEPFPDEQSVILVCTAKNECDNMKKIYSYYCDMGIKNFVFIDNDSSDDSVSEFNKMQGVNIFLAEESYTSIRRQAWINRVIAHYGFNRWYLVIDSDEYVDYNQATSHSFNEVVEFCENNHITRMQALMIDMYPENIEFINQKIDFLGEYKYFDKDTYEKMDNRNSLLLNGYQGGVRARLFKHATGDVKPWLTKYPLLYIQEGDIQFHSHMSFPFYKNFQSQNLLVIRHYKFLPSDLEKYRQRMKLGNFSHGSQEYKQYVAEMEKGSIVFFDERHSEVFSDSDVFYNIPIMTRICWEDEKNGQYN